MEKKLWVVNKMVNDGGVFVVTQEEFNKFKDKVFENIKHIDNRLSKLDDWMAKASNILDKDIESMHSEISDIKNIVERMENPETIPVFVEEGSKELMEKEWENQKALRDARK